MPARIYWTEVTPGRSCCGGMWHMKAGVSRLASLVSIAVLLVFTFLIQASTGAPAATTEIPPNSTNMVDCNGLSPVYQATKVNMKSLCADPVTRGDYGSRRFYDNGEDVGHDEPIVKFISGAPCSGNHMTYLLRPAADPTTALDPHRSDPTSGNSS